MGNAFRSVLASGGGGGTGLHVDSLTITHQPNTTTYLEGEVINTAGLVVQAVAGGLSGTVTNYCTISPQILDTAGTQEITVTYGDATATFNVTVYAIDTVEIITEPTKKQYHLGEALDLTGISVRASANSGALTKDVTNLCTYSPADGTLLTTQGNVTITATYNGVSDTCTVEVYGVTALAITTPPTKTKYIIGETIDYTGIVVTATYGSWTEVVSSDDYTVNPASGTTISFGATTVTVSYEGQSATTTINAYAYESISITTQPTTRQYFVGDTFSTSGMVVTGYADSGSVTRNITSQCTFSPADGATLSTADSALTVTATFDGLSGTTTVAVYVVDRIAVTTQPTKTSYYFYDKFSISGMVVKAYGNSDAFVRTVTSECTTSPANNTELTSAGNKTCTVTWRNKTTTFSYTVINTIYGAEWSGGSSPTWTRTDLASSFSNPSPAVNNGNGSSPFDNILPWSGMVREEDSQAGTLVKIPKFYYKWTRTGSKMKLQISSQKLNGFYVSPAHASGKGTSSERDYVYVGAYHCNEAYKSVTGNIPIVNITKATARTNIHNLGTKIWQWDYAMYWTIAMLYLVEYADWNSQAKIGTGVLTSLTTSGTTDSMKYHTGTTASSRSSSGRIRYRYIEDLWGNCFDWVDGLYIKNSNFYGIKNPANFSDTSNGTYIGGMLVIDGCISSFGKSEATGFEYALFPYSAVTDTSYSTYICDRVNAVSTAETIAVGSSYFIEGTNNAVGLFRFSISRTREETIAAGGCRLMKLP